MSEQGKDSGTRLEASERYVSEENVVVIDFGGQYAQLIARRVREQQVFCEVLPWFTPADEIRARAPRGLILTGGPRSVTEADSPTLDAALLELGVPVLGICYGAQALAQALGGEVGPAPSREFGATALTILDGADPIFAGIEGDQTSCWMSHGDQILRAPEGFTVSSRSATCYVASMYDAERRLHAVQFHPEVKHTPEGQRMIHNFLFDVCGCSGDWQMATFVEETIAGLRESLAGKKVLCAFSGGVDSSVAALLVHRAIGRDLLCIFVDHGLLRKGEAEQVERVFGKHFQMNIRRVDAQQRFLTRLEGVTDPEQKRKIIGEEFIRVFEEEAKRAAEEMGRIDVLVQGTIYPDVIESGAGNAAMIKSHHNVGGLPRDIGFSELVEPLRDLFKDEVRAAGTEMGIPDALVWRQPFPGPGLAVRIIGDITEDKIRILQGADAILREEVAEAGLDREISQYFAVLTNMRSVGVMGDQRTYDYTLALRAVTTTDFMTADWYRIPWDVLERISKRVVNEVGHINRVVYDITSKPPATIEWE